MAIDLGVILTLLLVVGFLAQWLAWRMRLPAILFLLLIGIVIGPATGCSIPTRRWAISCFLPCRWLSR
jgi:Kef-type K+ transport system membrane component KefB